MKIEKIRAAICANRRGHEKTSDVQIRALFNGLGAETQKQYLASVEQKGTANAGSTGTRPKVQIGPHSG